MIAHSTAVLVFLLALALLVTARGSATAGTEVRPDLVAQPADDLRIEYEGATKLLRFTTTAANLGSGALMIVAKDAAAPNERADGTSVVAYQRVFDELGGFTDYNIGSLIWHDEHGHYTPALQAVRQVRPHGRKRAWIVGGREREDLVLLDRHRSREATPEGRLEVPGV